MRKILTIILCIFTLIIMAGGIIYYLFEIKSTAIVLLKTDINPLLAIRGKIVGLDYEISKIPFSLLADAPPSAIQAGWSNNDIYVALGKQGKYWRAIRAYKKIPDQKAAVFIWGKCSSKLNNIFYVRYNMESLILSDNTARLIRKQIEDTAKTNGSNLTIDAEVILNRQAKGRINRIFVNDVPYKK